MIEYYLPQTVRLSDGTGFYTAEPNEDGGKNRGSFIPADRSLNTQLAEFLAVPSESSVPLISPDARKVAYVKQIGNTHELHVIEASTVDMLIASYENAPTLIPWNWSPDLKLITFYNSHPIYLHAAGIGIPPFQLTESVVPAACIG